MGTIYHISALDARTPTTFHLDQPVRLVEFASEKTVDFSPYLMGEQHLCRGGRYREFADDFPSAIEEIRKFLFPQS